VQRIAELPGLSLLSGVAVLVKGTSQSPNTAEHVPSLHTSLGTGDSAIYHLPLSG
jgi:hypothetical protein